MKKIIQVPSSSEDNRKHDFLRSEGVHNPKDLKNDDYYFSPEWFDKEYHIGEVKGDGSVHSKHHYYITRVFHSEKKHGVDVLYNVLEKYVSIDYGLTFPCNSFERFLFFVNLYNHKV
jgi:hypothetical protein